jgi:1,3,6,8-tetrahydroxynaphthalene synthase
VIHWIIGAKGLTKRPTKTGIVIMSEYHCHRICERPQRLHQISILDQPPPAISPVLCCPAVAVPEYVITREETLRLAEQLHTNHPQLPLVLRLIGNTGIQQRYLVQPIEATLRHPGFETRNLIYIREAKKRLPSVIAKALANADVSEKEIDAMIYVSCTGFTMPSLTSWMINTLGFRNSTCQIPIAQLGCAAGGAAINRAHDFCLAHPGANVLIVACEFCSLCYQPADLSVGNLLSNGLFGDAVAAAVVKSDSPLGITLIRNESRIIMGTEDWISYAVKATGFHFCLDKRVPKTMQQLAPELRSVTDSNGWDIADLDFYIIHAGGPRILDDLSRYLGINPHRFAHSRATLTEFGNIASVVVLDVTRRLFSDPAIDGGHGVIAGFGPGITAEISLGAWTSNRAKKTVTANFKTKPEPTYEYHTRNQS